MGLLVTMGVSMTLLAAATASFFTISRRSLDHLTMATAQERAKSVLSLIAFDLRMVGSGMPLGQAAFTIADATLGDAPLPILTSSTRSRIVYRINENGATTVLYGAEFKPSAALRSFRVFSAKDLEVGDTIYISNMLPGAGKDSPNIGGIHGLRGKIASIAAGAQPTITIDSSFKTSTGAGFREGSTVERVTDVILDSPLSGSGITRNPETGAVALAPRSTFTATYLDGNGNSLIPPLSATTIANQLSAIRITVQVTSDRPLLDGAPYVATATETVALRNLNVSR